MATTPAKPVVPSWTWASGVEPVAVDGDVVYTQYQTEEQLEDMTRLFAADLSEPYSVFTYRYFLHLFPHVAFLVGGGARALGYHSHAVPMGIAWVQAGASVSPLAGGGGLKVRRVPLRSLPVPTPPPSPPPPLPATLPTCTRLTAKPLHTRHS
jgi:hypothetical protein